jgi:hypothetical protein
VDSVYRALDGFSTKRLLHSGHFPFREFSKRGSSPMTFHARVFSDCLLPYASRLFFSLILPFRSCLLRTRLTSDKAIL